MIGDLIKVHHGDRANNFAVVILFGSAHIFDIHKYFLMCVVGKKDNRLQLKSDYKNMLIKPIRNTNIKLKPYSIL